MSMRVGITFHTFTEEYCSCKWSLEDMMELSSFLGKGVEIVGPAHQRGFPYLSYEFERQFKSAVERFELVPTSYGSYADPFMLPDRDLSEDELVDYTLPQLRSAASLGFPIVRLQYFVAPVVERLLPIAEKLGLKMGYELHAPLTLESAQTQRLMEQIVRLASPALGVIPDAGIFARSVPQFRIDGARKAGIEEPLISSALELWNANVAVDESLSLLKQQGLTADKETALEIFWGSFGLSDPRKLLEIMPHIIHVHGKFFSIENGDEPNLRYEEMVRYLVEGKYDGWLSTEYEGPGDVNSFEIALAHQQMVHRYLRKAEQLTSTR